MQLFATVIKNLQKDHGGEGESAGAGASATDVATGFLTCSNVGRPRNERSVASDKQLAELRRMHHLDAELHIYAKSLFAKRWEREFGVSFNLSGRGEEGGRGGGGAGAGEAAECVEQKDMVCFPPKGHHMAELPPSPSPPPCIARSRKKKKRGEAANSGPKNNTVGGATIFTGCKEIVCWGKCTIRTTKK